ncbi:MAG: tRNA lysidine(34) synthetase TilS [Cyanobacteriota bacterium]|nr:tRNA lysidine(34) synthetase TilS [Cyanobacteriota bacterium]
MILPSNPPPQGEGPGWSRWHERLHRHLRRHPGLLPAGTPLLLAVSGGQDSMVLTALLADLRRLHGWRLELWHGNHGWRPEASEQAAELAAWWATRGLVLHQQRAEPPPQGEAAARHWRYRQLETMAQDLACPVVVTGHTASDRAETVLLNLARGSHRRGLASLAERRALGSGQQQLVRPLLIFTRMETARICRELQLPVWPDASNDSPHFQRNRVRSEVLPVLEALHPGAARRISAMAGRLADEIDAGRELLDLAIRPLEDGDDLRLDALLALEPGNRRALLQHWLEARLGAPLAAQPLERLLTSLDGAAGSGRWDLGAGRWLVWSGRRLTLMPAEGRGRQAGGQLPAGP